MKMILKREWDAIDASHPGHGKVTISPGTHEVERISNPFGYANAPWLVLVGTRIGATERSWRQWENRDDNLNCNPDSPEYGKPIDWGEFEIIILD